MKSDSVRRMLMSLYRKDAKVIESFPMHHYALHFVAVLPGEKLHVKIWRPFNLRGGVSGHQRILEIETQIAGSTGMITRTARQSVNGMFAEEFEGHVVAVRNHCGSVCNNRTRIDIALRALISHLVQLRNLTTLGLGLPLTSLRFYEPKRAYIQIKDRINSFVAEHSGNAPAVDLLDYCSLTESTLCRPKPVLAHGDAVVENMLRVNGQLAIIDHDCMMLEHPFYDFVHFLLHRSCDDYFAGRLNLCEFWRGWAALDKMEIDCSRLEYASIATYILLKKLCVVTKPHNLHCVSRLQIIRSISQSA